MKKPNLSDKKCDGPIGIVYPEEEVKKSIKKLIDFCDIHKGTLIFADTFKEIIKEEVGDDLI